jgi:hypothetical protein
MDNFQNFGSWNGFWICHVGHEKALATCGEKLPGSDTRPYWVWRVRPLSVPLDRIVISSCSYRSLWCGPGREEHFIRMTDMVLWNVEYVSRNSYALGPFPFPVAQLQIIHLLPLLRILFTVVELADPLADLMELDNNLNIIMMMIVLKHFITWMNVNYSNISLPLIDACIYIYSPEPR